MEQDKKRFLEMIDRPAFMVQDGIITYCNQVAKNRQVREGMSITELLPDKSNAYQTYQGGVLYMTLMLGWSPCGATVTREDGIDVFLLDRDLDDTQLQILSLAAQQLRTPLSNAMIVMDDLIPALEETLQEQGAQLKKALFQLLRLTSNMADADRYMNKDGSVMEKTELRSFFREVFEKAQAALDPTGVTIQYTGPQNQVFSLTDRERMERAVYNLLSNAVKFSPKGSCVRASLVRAGDQMRLTIEDEGDGIAPYVQPSLYHRYLREPALEDSRFGLGLGMSLVRSVAVLHGGTVLIDQPKGTRVTMTFAVRKNLPPELRSPTLRISNYAGGRDLGLLEFSEQLPSHMYNETI